MGFTLMFTLVPIFISIIFVIVFSTIIFGIGSKVKENRRNNSMEETTKPARLIGKRTHVWGGHGDMSASTSYYATFEDEKGDRAEFSVSDDFYGLYAEGDKGMLTHQGTRFLHFERDRF